MMTTSNIGCRIRRRPRAFSILPVMLSSLSLTLPACGDKEEAPGPSHRTEITRAKEATDYEKSQRLLAEARLGTVLWLAVLGAGGALMLGVAIGSSSRRSNGGAQPEGPETGI